MWCWSNGTYVVFPSSKVWSAGCFTFADVIVKQHLAISLWYWSNGTYIVFPSSKVWSVFTFEDVIVNEASCWTDQSTGASTSGCKWRQSDPKLKLNVQLLIKWIPTSLSQKRSYDRCRPRPVNCIPCFPLCMKNYVLENKYLWTETKENKLIFHSLIPNI